MDFKQSKEMTDQDTQVFGVEATRPDTIARAELGNLDPQHTERITGRAAVDAALAMERDQLPPEEAVLVTDRPDLDSVATMAVLDARSRGEEHLFEDAAVIERVQRISESDRFIQGSWPGPRELPSRDNPWPEDSGRPLAGIGGMIADPTVPMPEKVTAMRQWLIHGQEPAGYRQKAEQERMDIVEALENGDITIEELDGIALVTSTHRSGTTLGYYRAPIVVARNPEFRFQDGEPHTKITIAQYEAGHVDMDAVLEELNTLDPAVDADHKWGGSQTVGGSPQGISTGLDHELIAEIVQRHTTKDRTDAKGEHSRLKQWRGLQAYKEWCQQPERWREQCALEVDEWQMEVMDCINGLRYQLARAESLGIATETIRDHSEDLMLRSPLQQDGISYQIWKDRFHDVSDTLARDIEIARFEIEEEQEWAEEKRLMSN